MNDEFIQEMAERCRNLATNADIFTKKRLLDLAAKYEAAAGKPSPASRMIDRPITMPLSARGAAVAPRASEQKE
jgi:hypothetical protein